ncbi:hypothetical protein [Aquibium microcysteis]|uniref:hypothetical protein n=1 Tax=Aquibium microcysteis TaxID=675281 RepID=UPI00165D0272|nr:hypothetical protein [Aquibium microcysteis]
MMISPATALDDVLDSLEAELASFSNPGIPTGPDRPDLPRTTDLPAIANDDLPDSPTHFVIAAYRAC